MNTFLRFSWVLPNLVASPRMTAEGEGSHPEDGNGDEDQLQGERKWHWGTGGKCDKQAHHIYTGSSGWLKQHFLCPASGMSERINNLFGTYNHMLVYFPFFWSNHCDNRSESNRGGAGKGQEG